MLYQKSLRIGVDVRNTRGVGTVVNLQSNDASQVWMMPTDIHFLWDSPLQVLLQAMYSWSAAPVRQLEMHAWTRADHSTCYTYA